MTENEIEVKDTGGGSYEVGGRLMVVGPGSAASGVYRKGEEGQAGAKLGNGGVEYAKRLIAGGKV